MKRDLVLLWKAWRDLRWFIIGGWLGIFIPSLVDTLHNLHLPEDAYNSGFITSFPAALILFFGAAWAIFMAITLTCTDSSEPAYTFWRSRPISPLRFVAIKYLSGLLSLALVTVPSLLVELVMYAFKFQTQAINEFPLMVLFCHSWTLALVFSFAFLLGVLSRRAVSTSMLAIAAALFIYFGTLLLPFLSHLSPFQWGDEGAVSAVFDPTSLYQRALQYSDPDQAWGLSFLGLRLSVKSAYLWFVMSNLALALVCFGLAVAALKRAWVWSLDLRAVCWSMGLVAMLMFFGTSRELGTSLPEPIVMQLSSYHGGYDDLHDPSKPLAELFIGDVPVVNSFAPQGDDVAILTSSIIEDGMVDSISILHTRPEPWLESPFAQWTRVYSSDRQILSLMRFPASNVFWPQADPSRIFAFQKGFDIVSPAPNARVNGVFQPYPKVKHTRLDLATFQVVPRSVNMNIPSTETQDRLFPSVTPGEPVAKVELLPLLDNLQSEIWPHDIQFYFVLKDNRLLIQQSNNALANQNTSNLTMVDLENLTATSVTTETSQRFASKQRFEAQKVLLSLKNQDAAVVPYIKRSMPAGIENWGSGEDPRWTGRLEPGKIFANYDHRANQIMFNRVREFKVIEGNDEYLLAMLDPPQTIELSIFDRVLSSWPDVVVSDDVIYVISRRFLQTVIAYDVSDPARTRKLGQYPVSTFSPTSCALPGGRLLLMGDSLMIFNKPTQGKD